VQELIHYIARFHPSYPGTVRGASPAEIGRLASLVKRPLPRSYRAFLETMGHSWGDFDPFSEPKDFSIETVIDFYETGEDMPPERFLLIAYDLGSGGLDYFLEDLGPGVEPRVVQFASDSEFDPANFFIQHESLADMLFTLAFAAVRLPLFPWLAHLFVRYSVDWEKRSSISRLDAFVALAEKMDFERVPFTGSWSPAYERGDAGMNCYQAPGFAPSFTLGATDPDELDRLAEILCDNLGLLRRD
jgi:hypothetical protein